jgi:hypothetical protein
MFAGDEFPQYEVFSDRAVLKKICLSSRRLYSISRPILGRLLRDTGSIKKRHALIRRFIQNPIAASYVRAIFVESFERRPAKMKFLGMGEDIRMAAEKIDMEGKEDWKKHMLYGGKDANVAMLLSLLPKLEFLHFMVETDLANDFPWTLALMRRAAEKSLAPATGPFSSLHAIRTTYVSAHIDPGFGPMGFACAMGLPTLREISVSMAWGNKLNDQHQDMLVSTIGTRKKGKNWTSKIHWPTAVSNVETLEFDDSTLDSEFLRNILTSCKSLQHFTYKWSLDLEGKETDVGFSGLVQSLSTQKHSLETLVLDSANVDWFGRYVYSPKSSLLPNRLSLLAPHSWTP